jgi:hypothetical protein
MTPIAQWSSVTKHYGKVAAVEDVSLSFIPARRRRWSAITVPARPP